MQLSLLKKIDLKACIHRICQSIPEEREMIEFIKICIRLSYGYLRYKESRGYRIRESAESPESNLEDIAVDAIADLFERNGAGEYIQLRRYFIPYFDQDPIDEEWLILLRRLVTTRTEQALHRVFKERDPETAKILRGIKIAVSKDSDLNMRETFRGNQITALSENHDSTVTKKVIDPVEIDFIMKHLFSLFRPMDSIPTLLQKIFSGLDGHADESIAIALSDATRIIRTYRRGIQKEAGMRSIAEVNQVEKNLIRTDITKRVEKMRNDLFKKLDRDYLDKGKMQETTVRGLKGALTRMIDDMLNEDSLRSNLSYIQEFLPDVTPEQYQGEIRTRFEYFVKLLKTRIKHVILPNSV